MEKQFCFDYEHYAALAELPEADRKLVAEAERATANAHAPYSKFRVGPPHGCAAGRFSTAAISKAKSPRASAPNGRCCFTLRPTMPIDPIETLAIASNPSERECYPCGQCRQVMVDVERRQGSPMRVIMSGGTATVLDSAARLLPFTFIL